ncbi:MAG TPA: VOC family protein [Burkholderiaceae bacterium]|nr:VOC family protein [Burkholderiaceae bacterium]
MNPLGAALDHLVVAAATLSDGVAWCEQTLGVTPGPGGAHPLFGTHNRLLRLDGPEQDPPAYLEIIAIDPAATPTRAAPLKRWFDLDDTALQHDLLANGPQLIHWVARVTDLSAALVAWSPLGLDRGPAIAASRPTPTGLLQWRLSVRDDGQRLLDGCLPTLIEWGEQHPARTMPPSGLRLNALCLRHPQAELLQRALTTIGLNTARVEAGAASLRAEIHSPRGEATLHSHP